jgi:hypothetical protein
MDTGIPQPCETLEYHNHLRHWHFKTTRDSEIPQPSDTLESHHHVGCEMPVSRIAVEFQCFAWIWDYCVSDCCGIPAYRMNLRLQCLIWLWGFNTSQHTEIPPPCETLAFYSHVRHWNYTAIWDTGIPQPCDTLEFHSHVRHWNFTTTWDTGKWRLTQQYVSYIVAVSFIGGGNWRIRKTTTDLSQVTDKLYHIVLYQVNKTDRHDITDILLKVALNTIKPTNQLCFTAKSFYHVHNSQIIWDYYVSDCCGIPTYRMNLRLQCLIWLWGFNTSHGYGITVYHIVVEFQCSNSRHWNFTAMWDTGISQPCEILELHMYVRHWNSTTMWYTVIP